MALFNITNLSGVIPDDDCSTIDFKASNATIRVDTLEYRVSELQIEYSRLTLLIYRPIRKIKMCT